LNGVQSPPDAGVLASPGGDPGLPAADQYLYGTGGTGLLYNEGPDIRISNVNTLRPGPFQITAQPFRTILASIGENGEGAALFGIERLTASRAARRGLRP
jgi:hypothetical protein